MRKQILSVAIALAAVTAAAMPATAARASGDPDVLYKSLVSPLPGNLPSVGFQATQTSEFGNQILMTKTANPLGTVVVTMSSWACQSGSWGGPTATPPTAACMTAPGSTFTEPITLNIYGAPATGTFVPGTLIVSATKTFSIPYRPSADATHCTGSSLGQWFDGTQGCFNGLAHNITFNLSTLHVTLPQDIVFGIAFNTSQFGPHPYGALPCESTQQGCPYDSLNVALSQDPTNVTKGHDPDFGKLWWNTATAANYCDGGSNGAGTFRLDSPNTAPCWGVNSPYSNAPFFVPAVQFLET